MRNPIFRAVSCYHGLGPLVDQQGFCIVRFHGSTSSLKCQNGIIRLRRGPGFGIDIKPFIPGYDTAEDAKVAEWLKKTGK